MRVSQNCYAVTGLGYSAPWCVNAGIVTTSEATLIIDTGANSLAAQTLFGYATAVARAPLLVINTEKHFDHIGGNHFFRSQGIDVWGHRAIARTESEFASEIAEFNAAISNPARRAAHEADAFYWETKLANPNRPIQDDMRLCGVEILMTPGHTATNIAVWNADDRVIFTGDCLIHKYVPNLDAGSPPDWRLWLDSIDRIEGLHPEVVVAGHGPVARGSEIAPMIDRVRETLRRALA